MADKVAFDEARAYFIVLNKRRGLILTCATVGLLTAALHNYTTRPVYEANAQLLIDWRTPNVLPHQELVDRRPIGGGADYFQTHFALLRGRQLAEKVIENCGPRLRQDLLTESRFRWVGAARRPLPAAAEPQGEDQKAALVTAFQARLTITPVLGTGLVTLGFQAFDPAVAAEAVNALAEGYIASSLDVRSATSSAATTWLGDRLREQQARVVEAEKAAQRYREREGLANLNERRGTAEQTLAALTTAVVRARTERVEKETLHNRMSALLPEERISATTVKASPVVESLRAHLVDLRGQEARLAETLGDRHPDLVAVRQRIARTRAAIDEEVAEVVKTVESDYKTAVDTETNLTASLDDAKREALALERKALEGDALERAAEGNRKLLQELTTRAKDAGLEAELRTTDLRLTERARPPRSPVGPLERRNCLLGLLGGLVLGVGLALLFERLDNTLKTPEDVKVQLRVPFLGMIPELRPIAVTTRKAGLGPGLVDAASAAAEAYRVLRTNLLFSSAEGGGRAYLVTSAAAGDGKTTTVANLAAALSQNDARVLVVDADLRRPVLHTHFELERAPGLSDLIVGNCSVAEAIQHTKVRGLAVMPSGYLPPNPAELLGSVSMKDLTAVLRKRFDWILFDAPPVLAMADALVLSGLTDGTILVIRADATPLPSAQQAIDHLGGVGGKLTGVVLNSVNIERHSYYYGPYYGDHARRYASRSEEKSPDARVVGGR